MGFIQELKEKSGGLDLRSHYVKSWDKTVYFKPISPAETNRVTAMSLAGESMAAMWSRYVVMKALDENKVRLFVNDDLKTLMELPYQSEIEELYLKMREVVTVAGAEEDFTINQG